MGKIDERLFFQDWLQIARQTSKIKEKIKRFAAPSGFGLVPVLFHVGEVSDVVHETKYFYIIIDITDFLTKENLLAIL